MPHRSIQNLVTLMLIVTSVGAVGQILLKIGLVQAGARPGGLGAIVRIMVTQPLVMLGLALYAMNTILYLKVLGEYPLSLVFPMIAFSYVITTVLAFLFLHEQVPPLRIAGLIAIVVGVMLMALSGRSAATAPGVDAAHAVDRPSGGGPARA